MNDGEGIRSLNGAGNATAAESPADASRSLLAPLRQSNFRLIWAASIASNFGTVVQTVAAAWAMTRLSTDSGMVAFVQTAAMLPFMLLAIPGGAIADLFDRRRAAMFALVVAASGAAALCTISVLGLLTPWRLLACVAWVSSGTALFSPAWQSSVREQVPVADLPAAISLNSLSFNTARSVGPAVGGVLVSSFGSTVAFLINALSYLPMIAALMVWRRPRSAASGPREGFLRAVHAGLQYAAHAPTVRTILIRVLTTMVVGSALLALLPLAVRDVGHGGASAYGLLLGAFGVGAVVGALGMPAARRRLKAETIVRLCALFGAAGMFAMAVSPLLPVTAIALVPAGAGWTMLSSMLNVTVQSATPRWVSARALSIYQAALAGGIALGSWIWGLTAARIGVADALMIAGFGALVVPVIGLRLPVRDVGDAELEPPTVADPSVPLPVDPRAGPVVALVEYRIALSETTVFEALMAQIESVRRRNGARDWSLSRDIAAPNVWIERFVFSSWQDYVRHRSRSSRSERALIRRAMGLHLDEAAPKARLLLDQRERRDRGIVVPQV